MRGRMVGRCRFVQTHSRLRPRRFVGIHRRGVAFYERRGAQHAPLLHPKALVEGTSKKCIGKGPKVVVAAMKYGCHLTLVSCTHIAPEGLPDPPLTPTQTNTYENITTTSRSPAVGRRCLDHGRHQLPHLPRPRPRYRTRCERRIIITLLIRILGVVADLQWVATTPLFLAFRSRA